MFRRQDPSRERTPEERARAAAERAARRSATPLPTEAFLHEAPPPPATEAGRAAEARLAEEDAARMPQPTEVATPAPVPVSPAPTAVTEDRPDDAEPAAPDAAGTQAAASPEPAVPPPDAAGAQAAASPDAAVPPPDAAGAQAAASPDAVMPPPDAAGTQATASPDAAVPPPDAAETEATTSPNMAAGGPSTTADDHAVEPPPAAPPHPATQPPLPAPPAAATVAPVPGPDASTGEAAADARPPTDRDVATEPDTPSPANTAPAPVDPSPTAAAGAGEAAGRVAGPASTAAATAAGADRAAGTQPEDASAVDEHATAPAPHDPVADHDPARSSATVSQPTMAFTPPDVEQDARWDDYPRADTQHHSWVDDEPVARPPLPRRPTEPLPPRKRGRRPPARARMPGQPASRPRSGTPRRRAGGRILALLALAAIAAALYFINATFQPFHGDGQGAVNVTIPAGADAGEIGEILADAGVVESGQFFMLNATLTGRRGKLKPGDYTLRRDMSNGQAVEALQQGPKAKIVRTFNITIPEGRSRRETAPLVNESAVRGNYLRASASARTLRRARRLGLPRNADTPEGYLFPATYELLEDATAQDLVDRQLKAFADNLPQVDMRAARRRNLSRYDVVKIASMVEREAQLDRERPLIAAVIHNRLREGMTLGIDATIRYFENNWTRPLRKSELDRDTPYNTRINRGLPPTPIGNPGLKSLQAAAKPANVDHLYYVVKPGTCGEHVFSSDYNEFLAAQARYEEARARAGGNSPTTC